MREWLRDAIQGALDREQEAIDAELAAILFDPPPPGIVRRAEIPMDKAYDLPGELFPDGQRRVVVNPGQEVKL
jgi:hypothetical protein